MRFNFLSSSKRRQRGVTLVEVAFAMILMAGGAMMLLSVANTQREGIEDRAIAMRMKDILDAQTAYINANSGAIMAAATSGVPIVVNVTGPAIAGFNSLQGAGLLSTSFAAKNKFGQTEIMLIRQPVAGSIEVVTTSLGGAVIPDYRLGSIAAAIGADGGFMASNPLASSTGKVTGSFGGWQAVAATWTSGINGPKVGHYMATMAFQNLKSQGQYLSRVNTGDANDQKMQIGINMNGNSITNAAGISGVSAVFSSEIWGAVFRDANNTSYYVQPSSNSVMNSITATGIVSGQYLSSSTTVTAGTACSQNGLIAKDATGNLMTCVSFVWKGVGVASFANGVLLTLSSYPWAAPSDGVLVPQKACTTMYPSMSDGSYVKAGAQSAAQQSIMRAGSTVTGDMGCKVMWYAFQ